MSDQYSRIFLLSHMRAFTSLAGHILGSHPQINGYYEMHISYDAEASLSKQLKLYQEHDFIKPGSRYFFDKLLHNDYDLRLDQLSLYKPKILVTLREPGPSIKSIVKLFSQKSINDPYASPEEATKYYVNRLGWLADFCRNKNYDYFYYDAEMLHQSAEIMLPRLAKFLELNSPLNEQYKVFSQTGKDRKGDSSEAIRSGKIIKTNKDYSLVNISQELLTKARQVYVDCREAILKNAADLVI